MSSPAYNDVPAPPSARREQRRPTLKAAVILQITFMSLMVLIVISSWVWIPDLFTDRTIVVGHLKTSDGDFFQVTQKFIGDGYLTLFDHTNKAGQSWHSGFAGDGAKAWRANFQQTNNAIIIHVLRQNFFYDLETHTMTDSKGDQRFVNKMSSARHSN